MQKSDPDTYSRILEGDRLALQKHSGHGSAIAQVYSHMIMPLSNRRDKETQIIWGLKDFESRFQRKAASIWLAETAVDLETLELMVQHGMQYVILAPRQAKCVRPVGDADWQDAENETVDSSRPYLVNLPNGSKIIAFFYNGELSRAVAFEGLLHNGHDFAHRIIEEFDVDHTDAKILNLATDGESYGHHHQHGDMALAYALDFMGDHPDVTLTNYAEYLSRYPVEWEAEIIENSSWSCIHGIERWRSNCGCHSGYQPDWNQLWRGPLREAFDTLRDGLTDLYANFLAPYCDNPWDVRNDYISVILDGSPDSQNNFFARWFGTEIETDPALAEKMFKALEMQRSLILMYTSCGWFFDEISGIETVQNLKYACRALELAKDIFDVDLEPEFLAHLEKAPSNIEDMKNGRVIYERYAKPSQMDFFQLAANFSVNLLESDHQRTLYDHRFSVTHYVKNMDEISATLEIKSLRTTEQKSLNISIRSRGEIALNIEVRDRLDNTAEMFSLSDLLTDQQRMLLNRIKDKTSQDVLKEWDRLYRHHYKTMKELNDFNVALPENFSEIAYHVQSEQIYSALSKADLSNLKEDVEQFFAWGFDFDRPAIRKAFCLGLEKLFEPLKDNANQKNLQNFLHMLEIADYFSFSMELESVQIDFYRWLKNFGPAETDWKDTIHAISQRLKILYG